MDTGSRHAVMTVPSPRRAGAVPLHEGEEQDGERLGMDVSVGQRSGQNLCVTTGIHHVPAAGGHAFISSLQSRAWSLGPPHREQKHGGLSQRGDEAGVPPVRAPRTRVSVLCL